ncbi:hypothetical protein M0802_011771 [Mischocyttarus mexicanus]|nr:hypothetical protein M0802_011771 [Mischocyttarus mexicanus]
MLPPWYDGSGGVTSGLLLLLLILMVVVLVVLVVVLVVVVVVVVIRVNWKRDEGMIGKNVGSLSGVRRLG